MRRRNDEKRVICARFVAVGHSRNGSWRWKHECENLSPTDDELQVGNQLQVACTKLHAFHDQGFLCFVDANKPSHLCRNRQQRRAYISLATLTAVCCFPLHIQIALTTMSDAQSQPSQPPNASAPPPGRRSPIGLRADPSNAPEPEDANMYSTALDSNARKLDALKKNPLVPAGAIGTGMVLMAGLFAFKTGNPQLSQQLMRARVLAQGATLSVLAVSVAGGMAAKAEEGER